MNDRNYNIDSRKKQNVQWSDWNEIKLDAIG